MTTNDENNALKIRISSLEKQLSEMKSSSPTLFLKPNVKVQIKKEPTEEILQELYNSLINDESPTAIRPNSRKTFTTLQRYKSNLSEYVKNLKLKEGEDPVKFEQKKARVRTFIVRAKYDLKDIINS